MIDQKTASNGLSFINIPGITADRPDVTGPLYPATKSVTQWFNTASFTPQIQGTAGNEAVGKVYGPHDRRFDLSFVKDTALFREASLEFRAECFNVTNTPNFAQPDAYLGSATFGQILSTSGGENPRQFQFALKVLF